MAQLDTDIGVIQDRRKKLMKSMKAKEAQVALLFSDNHYIKSEWSAKTIMSNPLKPIHTLEKMYVQYSRCMYSACKSICDDLETIRVKEIEPIVIAVNIENEGSELLANLCKKAAYIVEIFCWQNVRDVVADEIIPRTDQHIERLLAATKIVLDIEEPMFMTTLNTVIAQYNDLLVRM